MGEINFKMIHSSWMNEIGTLEYNGARESLTMIHAELAEPEQTSSKSKIYVIRIRS